MVKNRLLRATAMAVTSVGLVAGFSGIAGASAGTATITTTGPHSLNRVHLTNNTNTNFSDNTHLNIGAETEQNAESGKAVVAGNTNGGSASTGDARNVSSTTGNITVNHTMPTGLLGGAGASTASATISDTGPFSSNEAKITNNTETNIDMETSLCLTTSTDQHASTGKAVVAGNTNGGSASTGDATNTSTTSLNVTL